MNRLPVSKALRALLELGTGKPCGLGGFPTNAPTPPSTTRTPAAPPYTILYSVPGTEWSGPPLFDDHADVEWVYQVTSVGSQPDQAEWMGDRARRVLVGRDPVTGAFFHDLVVPGLSVVRRAIVDDGGGDGEGNVAQYVERYAIAVTPITGDPA